MSKKIAILASGSGSNAENIVSYFAGNSDFEFPLIISNKIDAFVHERAKKLKISSFTFSKSDFDDGQPVIDLLQKYEIDIIVLAGFLLKVPKTLIDAFPQKIVNIHPALLPKYGGKGMYGDRVHAAVHAAGETLSGITIHFVDENYDEGSIVFQAECTLCPIDTPQTIARKVHMLEYEWYPKIIERVFG